MLDMKTMEFRQFESIVLKNTETGETREFLVKDVRRLYPSSAGNVKKLYSKVSWIPDLPIFAIDLGDELDRNDIIFVPNSVPQRSGINDQQKDIKTFEIPEVEKTWHGVGD